MRGRPPLRPFLCAAAALGAEDFRPPTRPSSASHSGTAKAEERRPGTLKSRSRLSKCKPPPRPSISTERISREAARLRSGTSFTGKVIAAPFWPHALRRGTRERNSPAAPSLSIESSGVNYASGTKRLGYLARHNCPRTVPNSSETA